MTDDDSHVDVAHELQTILKYPPLQVINTKTMEELGYEAQPLIYSVQYRLRSFDLSGR